MDRLFRHWPWAAPLVGWAVIGANLAAAMPPWLLGLAMVASVLAAVHHAERVALRVGEPLGTFVLAVAVTAIELGLILTLMFAAGHGAATLARDTVFAAVMLILNGLMGICILIGAIRYREQAFQQSGVSAALATICALTVLTLVLPNFTKSEPGPVYTTSQLAFVAIVSFLLYVTFASVQTLRHRDYFLPPGPLAADADVHAELPTAGAALVSSALMIVCLAAVVLLADTLEPAVERAVERSGAPLTLVGVIIAALVLLPEAVAAVRAALANRLQTSLNLALGSVLTTIGLTIPAVAAASLVMDFPIELGLDARGTVLLFLTLIVSTLSLGTGRTTILQGAVHLVVFGVFLFTTIVP